MHGSYGRYTLEKAAEARLKNKETHDIDAGAEVAPPETWPAPTPVVQPTTTKENK